MANRLRKHVEVAFVQEATPARPAVAESWNTVCTRYLTGWNRVRRTQRVDGGFRVTADGKLVSIPSRTVTVYVLEPVYRQECTTYYSAAQPYVPATPRTVWYRGDNKWDGGARSIESQTGDLKFTFYVPRSPLGVVCGLSNGAKVRSFDHVAYGFLAQKDQPLRILERGRVVVALPAVDVAARPKLSVVRVGDTITYEVDGEVAYTSAVKTRDVLYAEATLYNIVDFVEDPVFAPLANGSVRGRVPPPVGTIHQVGYAGVGGLIPLPVLSALSTERYGVSGRVPTPTPTVFDAAYAVLGGAVPTPALAVAGLGELVGVAGGGGRTPSVSVAMRVLEGHLATVEAQAPAPLGLISSGPLAAVYGFVPPPDSMGSFAIIDTPTSVAASDPVVIGDYAIIDYPLMIATLDGVGVVSTLELTLVAQASVMDALNIGDSVAMSGSLFASLFESLHIVTDIGSARRTGTEYAVNIVSGALSEYQGFGFTQYARVGQQLWGCRPDGLYRLGGDVAMDALVDFGTIDLGNQNLKRLSTAFIGVRTDGQVFLRVTTDGVERVYSAVGRDDMRKVQLARGVSARNWSMQLQVTDASYASLDSVEFEIGISQRKTGGRR